MSIFWWAPELGRLSSTHVFRTYFRTMSGSCCILSPRDLALPSVSSPTYPLHLTGFPLPVPSASPCRW